MLPLVFALLDAGAHPHQLLIELVSFRLDPLKLVEDWLRHLLDVLLAEVALVPAVQQLIVLLRKQLVILDQEICSRVVHSLLKASLGRR